ncbi:uncharacterized protein [Euphorbia lathyris]|uniref:uncharacterized protein n=1 Tax=Euphorbia lathyris TaxID=212925 RepID=UPI003313499B
MALASRGGAMGLSSFPPYFTRNHRPSSTFSNYQHIAISRTTITCSALQESSTSTTAETKEVKKVEAKPKPPPKAPVKPLPQMMEEDVIPSLKAILEADPYITQLQLSFKDNRLEGSFIKKDNPYIFWAFFPNGNVIGPKGFSLSSYGLEPSTVEPFLIDEKKITARHIIFWVEKRLAAQGIIPVWKQ